MDIITSLLFDHGLLTRIHCLILSALIVSVPVVPLFSRFAERVLHRLLALIVLLLIPLVGLSVLCYAQLSKGAVWLYNHSLSVIARSYRLLCRWFLLVYAAVSRFIKWYYGRVKRWMHRLKLGILRHCGHPVSNRSLILEAFKEAGADRLLFERVFEKEFGDGFFKLKPGERVRVISKKEFRNLEYFVVGDVRRCSGKEGVILAELESDREDSVYRVEIDDDELAVSGRFLRVI